MNQIPLDTRDPAQIDVNGQPSTTASVAGHAPVPVRALVLLAFACLCVVYFAWAWSDDITDLGGDSSVYMLAARFFSPFWSSSTVFGEFAHNMAYPPLFPLVIGLFGGSMLAGHLVAVASLLAAIACIYSWIRTEQIGWGIGCGVCCAFALMPGTYLQALNIWSENSYLALSLLAIALQVRAEKAGEGRQRFWWGTSVAVALASMVRAAALPLIVAYAIRVAIVRPRHSGRLISVSAMPFLLWAAWSKLRQSSGAGYAAQWADFYTHDGLQKLFHQAGYEALLMLPSWKQAWLAGGGAGALINLVMVSGVIALAGCLRRLLQMRFDAVYVALYGIVLLVWPFPAEARRLSYVVIPILLVQGVLLLRDLGRGYRKSGDRLLPGVWIGALLLVIVPSLILTAHRFREGLSINNDIASHMEGWYDDDRPQALRQASALAAMLADLRQSATLMPDGSCVFAIKPSVVSLYSGHPSYTPPPISAGKEDFDRGIARCNYAYAIVYRSPSFPEAYYPVSRLGERAHPLSAARQNDSPDAEIYASLMQIDAP